MQTGAAADDPNFLGPVATALLGRWSGCLECTLRGLDQERLEAVERAADLARRRDRLKAIRNELVAANHQLSKDCQEATQTASELRQQVAQLNDRIQSMVSTAMQNNRPNDALNLAADFPSVSDLGNAYSAIMQDERMDLIYAILALVAPDPVEVTVDETNSSRHNLGAAPMASRAKDPAASKDGASVANGGKHGDCKLLPSESGVAIVGPNGPAAKQKNGAAAQDATGWVGGLEPRERRAIEVEVLVGRIIHNCFASASRRLTSCWRQLQQTLAAPSVSDGGGLGTGDGPMSIPMTLWDAVIGQYRTTSRTPIPPDRALLSCPEIAHLGALAVDTARPPELRRTLHEALRVFVERTLSLAWQMALSTPVLGVHGGPSINDVHWYRPHRASPTPSPSSTGAHLVAVVYPALVRLPSHTASEAMSQPSLVVKGEAILL